MATISELPPSDLQREAPHLLDALHAPWHEYLINPVGAILQQVSAPSSASYAYRFHDVNGLIALLNAKLALRAQRVAADGIAAALANSPLRNPYDNSALGWNATEQMLFFTSPDEQSKAARLRHIP